MEENNMQSPKKVICCKLKDTEKLMASQSGGAFTAIATAFLKCGGIVYGCGMDNLNQAVQTHGTFLLLYINFNLQHTLFDDVVVSQYLFDHRALDLLKYRSLELVQMTGDIRALPLTPYADTPVRIALFPQGDKA